MRTPNRFVSLMLVCGGGDVARAMLISHCRSEYEVHQENDDIIPVAASRQMVERLKELDANVRFTVYPDLMHEDWSAAYGNIEVYRWMIKCTRNVRENVCALTLYW